MMEREEKLKKAALLEEEEFGEENGGMTASAGTESEQADGVTPPPNFMQERGRTDRRRGAGDDKRWSAGTGGEPIDDEALEAVSGGLRVMST